MSESILSRCQIYDFKRIGVEDIANHLAEVAEKEQVAIEREALHVIAQKADGALRDALSIFDRIVSFSGEKISYQDVIDNLRILDYDYYFRTTEHILNQDQSSLLLLFDKVLDNGFDGHQYINGLAAHFRDLLVCKDARTLELLEVSEGTRQRYREQAEAVPVSFLLKALKLTADVDNRYKGSNNARLLVELCLLQLKALVSGDSEKKTPDASNSSPAPSITKKVEKAETKEEVTTSSHAEPPVASAPQKKEEAAPDSALKLPPLPKGT